MLEVQRLSKSFGSNRAVDGVTFRVAPGEAYGLLGPNGAGKSTTIHLVLGLLVPDAGAVKIGGIDLRREPDRARQQVGFVPQEIALYPTLSARENLFFWGRMYSLAGRDLAKGVDASLETVGLTERARERVETFSGGMKRRVNIAAALLHAPKMLIMDEPTVGVDPQSRGHILETVKRLNASGLTVLYTSHYMGEVEQLCSRIGIMDHGRIIAEGSLAELRRVVGEYSLITVSLAKTGVDADGTRILDIVRALPGVHQAAMADGAVSISTLDPSSVLPAVTVRLGSLGRIQSVSIREPDLEAVFLHLTGHALRD